MPGPISPLAACNLYQFNYNRSLSGTSDPSHRKRVIRRATSEGIRRMNMMDTFNLGPTRSPSFQPPGMSGLWTFPILHPPTSSTPLALHAAVIVADLSPTIGLAPTMACLSH